MALALVIFGVSFAAFCVWLTVRIINRRERWAQRTAFGIAICALLLVLYLGSFILVVYVNPTGTARSVGEVLYAPIGWFLGWIGFFEG